MKGSCLCGAIEYEIDSIDMPITHCHCKTCRKAHAAPFASTAGVMREHFRWLKGEEKLSDFESSQGKLRHFCSVCGSHLMAERLNFPHVIVRVATLDDDPLVTAQQHIWTSHNVSWLNYENLDDYPEWQTERNSIKPSILIT
jgi:ADP-ribosyl-[dinitrogen reductase] hydrolase